MGSDGVAPSPPVLQTGALLVELRAHGRRRLSNSGATARPHERAARDCHAFSWRRPLASMTGPMGRPFWTLIFAMVVNHLGTMVGPFLPLWLAREHGEEEAAIAALLAIANASASAGSPAGGWLADAIGRRWSLILGLVVN